MIKTTPKQIGGAMVGLKSLLDAKLPAKAKYSVVKLAEACQGEMERFQKAAKAVFEAAGCEIKDDRWAHADSDTLHKCEREVEDLATVECEIAALPLDIEQFGDAEIDGPGFLGMGWAMKAD